jgi:uncharacterized repeat protein (TIGR03943 family)
MQHAVLATVGGIAVTTAWHGLYLNFVKPGLRWWLIAAGGVVLVMGLYGMLTEDEVPANDGHKVSQDPGADEPHHGPRIGWLLLLPFLVLSLIVPPALGSYSAERDSGALRKGPLAEASFPRLPITDAPVTMRLSEYSSRAVFERGKSLKANRVRLIGFVSSRPAGQAGPSWYLTRMAMSCCAADGYAIKVDVRGQKALPNDTWVAVTGHWVPSASRVDDPNALAALQVESLQTVARPAEVYEY